MRRVILALALCSVAACATPVSLTPVTYVNATKADEQGALTAELAYKTWRLAVETGVKAGVIKGATATHVASLDNQLYAALQTVESAYATGNSASISSAVGNFNTTLTVGYTAIGGR